MPPPRPSTLQINAWRGAPVSGPTWDKRNAWGATERAAPAANLQLLAPKEPADERDWRHDDVGWGLVAPDDPSVAPAVKAAGEDLPAPLRRLIEARRAPVFRFNPGGNGRLRRYYADGGAADWDAAGARAGRGQDRVPRYLMIWGAPSVIPWRFQYTLNMSSYVGRIDLQGDALARYVECLLTDFAVAAPDPLKPVIWSVNHGGSDITNLMEQVIADALHAEFVNDTDLAPVRCAGDQARVAWLAEAIDAKRPGLVVTTSHGLTGPATDRAALQARLGGLVDAEHDILTAADLAPASTGGAIWYSHACCSAGSDSESQLQSLFKPGHEIGDALREVSAGAGAMIAPLPAALLAADPPIRAFVGHVEPAFDWTLRDYATGQVMTSALIQCLYNRLFQRRRYPIGYALAKVFDEAGAMLTLNKHLRARVDEGDLGALDEAIYREVAALDRQSVVILGDPAVTIPGGS